MNFNEFIGLKYKHKGRGPKYDCYGLIRSIFLKKREIELPDFLMVDYSIDWYKKDENNIENNLWKDWEEVNYPFKVFDCLLFFYGNTKMANHIGMWIAEDKVIHLPIDSTSKVDRFIGILEKKLYKAIRYKRI